jgi:hypothetical protein
MKMPLLLAPVLFVSACQTKQAVWFSPQQYQEPQPKENRSISHYVSGDASPFVRQSEVVKAYGINRYVDPSDSRIMHERHAIYRLEQQPDWITRTPRAHQEIILGPLVGLRKPEYAPEPLPGETTGQWAEVRRRTQQTDQEVNGMQEGQAKLASSVEALAKETVDAQRKLTSAVSVLNQRIGRLENAGSVSADGQAGDPGDSGVVVHPPK